jgi:hypothetical protein
MTDFTETEIKLAMEAHECTREEAIETYAAMVRAYREAQAPGIKLSQLRFVRNQKLAETDWWAVADRTMTQEQKDYRKALRDITETYSSLEDVVWPDKP